MSNKNKAQVDQEIMTDGSIAFNVVYRDANGYPVLWVGCEDEAAAEELCNNLNNASWVSIDDGGTVGAP